MVLAQRVCAWALVLLGGIHMAFTAVVYKSWSLGAAWFLGTGVAFVVLGFLNLVSSSGASGVPRRPTFAGRVRQYGAPPYRDPQHQGESGLVMTGAAGSSCGKR
jgi:hypothetical protein